MGSDSTLLTCECERVSAEYQPHSRTGTHHPRPWTKKSPKARNYQYMYLGTIGQEQGEIIEGKADNCSLLLDSQRKKD
jgi:hypothetical protein